MKLKDKALEEQKIVTKSPPSFFKISEQVEAIINATSDCDTKNAVGMIEEGLGQIIDSGACLNDIAPVIGSLPIEAKKLVLAALEEGAYILLSLLQKVYIWQDERQYHWFMALSYKSLWHNKEVWENPMPFPLDWEKNTWAICETENVALATISREEAFQKGVLERFDEELLLSCAKYDAIKVFKSANIDPVRLKDHVAILAKNGAAKLLQLYQSHTKIPHLHLEKFPFPEKLPANTDDFKFLLDNGYNCFPMDKLIEEFYKGGQLDPLKYLRKFNRDLFQSLELGHLECAAKKNQRSILDWSRKFVHCGSDNYDYVLVALLDNNHFDTAYWWTKKSPIPIHKNDTVGWFAGFGALEILYQIDSTKSISRDVWEEAANKAAVRQHLHILKWLYERYKILPTPKCLRNSTTDMLNWIRSKDSTLINVELVESGHDKIELLRWVFENAPQLRSDVKRVVATEKVCTLETMQWLHKNLGICSFDMDWAYRAGDLTAIQWAKENCGIDSTLEDGYAAARNGHFHIIYWIHEASDIESPLCFNLETLNAAIGYGKLEIADYLIANFPPTSKVPINISDFINADQYLAILKWAFKRNFDLDLPNKMYQAAKRGFFESIKWLVETFPTTGLDSLDWEQVTRGPGFSDKKNRLYTQLLREYPNWRGQNDLKKDLGSAFHYSNSHSLEMIQAILEKDPLLVKTIPKVTLSRYNCFLQQWPIANDK